MHQHLSFSINLANIPIAINCVDGAQGAAIVFQSFFRNFVSMESDYLASVTVAFAPESFESFPVPENQNTPAWELMVPNETVVQWFEENKGSSDLPPAGNISRCVYFQEGLLLFSSKNKEGRIYLLDRKNEPFKCLFRLLWVCFGLILGEFGGSFVHGAALVRDGEGYLFMGHSGKGKTTLAHAATHCVIYSDDSPIVRQVNGSIRVFPSPFHQLADDKKTMQSLVGISASIKNLYFLIHSPFSFIKDISESMAFSLVMKWYILFFELLSPPSRTKLFDLWTDACKNIPAYRYHYLKGDDVWNVIPADRMEAKDA